MIGSTVQTLPIDAVLPEVIDRLREGGVVVVEAPPGAGKTTRIPRAVLESGVAGDGEIVVLEPRRLAARMAARRVASEVGERVGETVGYQVRFDEKVSARTRIRFVTEGILTRRLVSDPMLRGVSCVVLDEFHERHLPSDVALAFLDRLKRTARPDLKVVVMSATLDGDKVASFLSCPVVRSEGRAFPVSVEHISIAEARDSRPDLLVISGVRRALSSDAEGGDVLVFLPGMSEIRRAINGCADFASAFAADLLPLHGDLSPEEQDRAVSPGPRRKVVFATNVAETSVTIEGVTTVVDSGLARVSSLAPWSGRSILELRKVSKASSTQRAGRAGRVRPGRVLRLYTEHDLRARPDHETPEILREDLAEVALDLAVMGADDLRWLDPPPSALWRAALDLLAMLGAVGHDGHPTPLGRSMARFPLHPRISRLLLEADLRGFPEAGAIAAALLAERDLSAGFPQGKNPTGSSDIVEAVALFESAARVKFSPDRCRGLSVDPSVASAVDRTRRQLLSILNVTEAARRNGKGSAIEPPPGSSDSAILHATLAGYPDRVGRRRAAGATDVVLCGGGSARLSPSSVVRDAPLMVAVDVEEKRGERRPKLSSDCVADAVTIRIASEVTVEMLFDLSEENIRWEEEATWNDAAGRVDGRERIFWRDLPLDDGRRKKPSPDVAASILFDAVNKKGRAFFDPDGVLDRLATRLRAVAAACPGAGPRPFDDEVFEDALRIACEGRCSLADLREADLSSIILDRLPPGVRGSLGRLAPDRVALHSGRTARVNYPTDGSTPFVESRLQDFFGQADGPRVADGRVPLLLHLLAPNGRAVQVTSDLAGFWERHYPALRKELSRRYPRHAWPEDPRNAKPPSKGK